MIDRAFGALAVLLSLAASADADWQYTKWGMTEEQVVKASNGKATPYADPEPEDPTMKEDQRKSLYITKLRAPYKSGTIPLSARFAFRKDNGALAYVHLSYVEGTDCAALYVALNKRYEKPFSSETLGFTGSEVISWHDKEHNNRVTWTLIGSDKCFIQYEALSDADTSGL